MKIVCAIRDKVLLMKRRAGKLKHPKSDNYRRTKCEYGNAWLLDEATEEKVSCQSQVEIEEEKT